MDIAAFVSMAVNLATSINSSKVEKVALTYRLDTDHEKILSRAGWTLQKITLAQQRYVTMNTIFKRHNARWVENNRVQRRKDSSCTSLKFLAWNMTQYDKIMVSDADACLLEDPLNWTIQHAKHEFIAVDEVAPASYTGLNSHLMMITPSARTFDMLVRIGKTKTFIPRTNGDQDVIETIYSNPESFPQLPVHRCWSHNVFKTKCRDFTETPLEVKRKWYDGELRCHTLRVNYALESTTVQTKT
jgi:alpha-N-acetylglucosamine transferase